MRALKSTLSGHSPQIRVLTGYNITTEMAPPDFYTMPGATNVTCVTQIGTFMVAPVDVHTVAEYLRRVADALDQLGD